MPIGSPLPLGLFGPAAGTFVLGGLQLGWLDAELLASIVSLLARDGLVATTMPVLVRD